MTAEAPEIRRSLLPSLLAAAAHNRRQGESWIRAFEIGNVFWTTDEIRESRAIGGLLTGPLPPRGLCAKTGSSPSMTPKVSSRRLLRSYASRASTGGRKILRVPAFRARRPP